jgi:hypothetical protein
MVWVDMTAVGTVHVAIEYGVGAERVCVEATGASVAPTVDECVEQLLWKTWSASRAPSRDAAGIGDAR